MYQLLIADDEITIQNGLAALTKLQGEFFSCKVIVISGYDNFSYAQKALRLGVFDYLLKPVSHPALYNTLRSAIRELEKRNWELKVLQDAGSNAAPATLSLKDQALRQIGIRYADSELNLTALAQELHVSPAYLSRIIKQETGKTFSDYLLELRMEKACVLLSNPNPVLIYSIAEKVGYTSHHYFCRCFKAYTGKSPTEYRRSFLEKRSRIRWGMDSFNQDSPA